MGGRRLGAIGALLLGFVGLAVAVAEAVQEFPRRLIALACVVIGAVAAWSGLIPELRGGPGGAAGE